MYLPETLLPLSLLANRSAPTHVDCTIGADRGPQYGSISIINSCYYDVHVRSIGAWPQSQTHEGEKEYTIPARSSHNESYRESCPKPSHRNTINPPPFCLPMGKVEGQGVSLKVSKNKVGDGPENILQLEYSLQQNPERGDDFPRLDYDISLLNCQQIENITEIQVAADAELNFRKMSGCPGVQGGVALWFDDHVLCRPIYCNGHDYCDAIYNYQRTGEGEDSLACHAEYKGNMYLELCVGSGDGHARRRYHEWASTATSIAADVWTSQLQSDGLATATPSSSSSSLSFVTTTLTMTVTTTTVTTESALPPPSTITTTVTTGLCPRGRYPLWWYPRGRYRRPVYPPGAYPAYDPLRTHSPVLHTHPTGLTTSCRTDLSVSDGIIRTATIRCSTFTTTGTYTTGGGGWDDIRCNRYGSCWSYLRPGEWAPATSTVEVTSTVLYTSTVLTTSTSVELATSTTETTSTTATTSTDLTTSTNLATSTVEISSTMETTETDRTTSTDLTTSTTATTSTAQTTSTS